jgi:glutamate-5-semialdehyde dehydrogenase
MNAEEQAGAWAARAKAASRQMAVASTAKKNAALDMLAHMVRTEHASVLAANAIDLAAAREANISGPMLDRLTLTPARLEQLARAVVQVATQLDPVGAMEELQTQPSGIVVGRMCVPLGVVLMVYESRPNVTVDTAALCLKAGNAVILRGGKEALHTNQALATLVARALDHARLPADAAVFVDNPDRTFLHALLRCHDAIDVAVPRGGTSLIEAVTNHARMPVIQHYQGICHVYVHEAADLAMAVRIVDNAKVQRPGVCNAVECVVVDAAVAGSFLPQLAAQLGAHDVELRGCDQARAIVASMTPATSSDFDTEFLSLVLAVKVVSDVDDALVFIAAHGSRHTASIVTAHHPTAMRFLREVDASCVLINASTRFNDGGELGLGAELGISTSKLHAYGPMGVRELCTRKFVVFGHGEVRA